MELPDDFFGGVEFDDLMAIAAGDEEISIGEGDDFVRQSDAMVAK